VDELRGSPMSVGTLEEMIDDNHAIVASAMGPEYYVSVMSFVNQDLLEPGCSVLLHSKVRFSVKSVHFRVRFLYLLIKLNALFHHVTSFELAKLRVSFPALLHSI
jgi:hypothetical protein